MPPSTPQLDTSELDNVLAQIDEVIEWSLQRPSHAGYFAAMYHRMTRGVKDDILAGQFDDAERMVRFDRLFADYYVRAFAAFRAGEPLTGPWRVAFSQTELSAPLIFQHLVLAMNAHINFDLALAVVDLAAGAPLEPLKPDYDRINAIIARLLGRVQDSINLVSPGFSWLDILGGSSDEALFEFSVERARAGAWNFAQRLSNADGPARTSAIAHREAVIARLARQLARPGFPVGLAVRGVALFETKDVRRVIEVLRRD